MSSSLSSFNRKLFNTHVPQSPDHKHAPQTSGHKHAVPNLQNNASAVNCAVHTTAATLKKAGTTILSSLFPVFDDDEDADEE